MEEGRICRRMSIGIRQVVLVAPMIFALAGCGNIVVGDVRVTAQDSSCACGPRRAVSGCEVEIEIDVEPADDSMDRVLQNETFIVEIGNESFDVRPRQHMLRIPWLAQVDDAGPGIYQKSVSVRIEGQTRVIDRTIEVVVPQSNPDTPQLDCLWFEPGETPRQSIGTVQAAVSPGLAEGAAVVTSLRDADAADESGLLMALELRSPENGERLTAAELPGEPPLLDGLVCDYVMDAYVVPPTDVIRWRDSEDGPMPVSFVTSAEYRFSGACTPKQRCHIGDDGRLDCVETQEDFLNGPGIWP